ncbi:enoyl-CoA hydratase 1-like protein [Marinobacter lipolyticus SM19]|uniref:Enoyl-CoA hydratase 1-like protein n=1 Tax=Marinobacter lipolyticus SM19 TaxID=1318628 RepID=R8B108_9GAMM|nr:MaoC family dehydratase [Marinobacter lipolyticus]EON92265.1 enoyl-CoA hydratase 1-like protein [Marinobacter lipolyticus SM19]
MVSIALNDLDSYTGVVIGHSPWKTISQDMIQAFADATGDHQWIHVDVERAEREAPWKSPVAHGFLTVSLIPQLNQQLMTVTGTSASINYGMNKLRFPAAVRSGSDIRTRVELQSVTKVDDQRTLAAYKTTVEIRGEDKPACVAENLVMYVE